MFCWLRGVLNYVSFDSSAESKDVTSFFSRKFGAFREALVPSPEDILLHVKSRASRASWKLTWESQELSIASRESLLSYLVKSRASFFWVITGTWKLSAHLTPTPQKIQKRLTVSEDPYNFSTSPHRGWFLRNTINSCAAWQKGFQLPSKQLTVMLEKTCVGHYWTHLISVSNPAKHVGDGSSYGYTNQSMPSKNVRNNVVDVCPRLNYPCFLLQHFQLFAQKHITTLILYTKYSKQETGVVKCPILGILDITWKSSHLVDHIPHGI